MTSSSRKAKQSESANVSIKVDHEALIFLGVVVVLGVITYIATSRPQVAAVDAGGLAMGSNNVATVLTTTSAPTTTTSTAASTGGAVVAESGSKFAIGSTTESMVVQFNGGGMRKKKELSAASKLADEARNAKSIFSTKSSENAVAQDLATQLKRAKNVIKESLKGEYPDHYNLDINPHGFGQLHAPIGGGPAAHVPADVDRQTFSFDAPNESMPYKTVEADTRPLDNSEWHTYHGGKTLAEVSADYTQRELVASQKGMTGRVFTPKDRKWTGDPGWNGFFDWSPNNENAMADDSANTTHSFDANGGGPGDGKLSNGIGQEQWDKQGTDWDSVKGKLLVTVKNICGLFDRLFAEELFPDAIIDIQNNGQTFIRDGKEGKCIRVDRYYEYVQSSVIAQLALAKVGPLPWARSVELGFDAIEKAKLPLRSALVSDCGRPEGSFVISPSGEVKTADGKAISVTLPWPKDQSTLYDHPMQFKKSKK